MIRTILIWLLLCICLLGNTQVITIKDKITFQPIEGVNIISLDNNIIVTDEKGCAELYELKNTDSIRFEVPGYLTVITTYNKLAENNFELVLEKSEITLNEVIVSAIRREQFRKDVPNKIDIISSADIQLNNPQTAADLLSVSGDIFIQKSQLGGGSPMIRGFATNRVLISVDGVRMNTAIFRSGNLQNVISIDPLAVEKTEIIFGPGSVVYGSDAIGGVMSFYTLPLKFLKNQKYLVKGNALIRFSSADKEKTMHFDVNYGKGKWALATSATYSSFDDLKMGSNGPDEYLRPSYAIRINGIDSMVKNPDPKVQVTTGYNQVNLMQKIGFQPTPDFTILYGFHYSATTDYSRYDRLIRYRNGIQRSAEWYYGPQVWMMNNLNLTSGKANLIYDKADFVFAVQYFKESRHDRNFQDSQLRRRIEEVYAYSANADFEKSSGIHTIFYGAEVLYNKVLSAGKDEDIATGTSVNGPSRYPNPANWKSYAAYLNYSLKPSARYTLQAGIRYNLIAMDCEFDTTFYPFPFKTASMNMDALTGSLGLSWSPNNNWLVNLHLSTGFRSPNVDDIGKVFDSEPGSVVVPNTDLGPEYAWNGEINVTKLFGNWLKVGFSAYYTLLDNALVRRDYTLNGNDSIIYSDEMSKVQAIQNAASATVYGFQTAINVNLPIGFGISSTINYQKGEEELDDGTTAPLRHAAPMFGSTHLTYKRKYFVADLYAAYNNEISYENLAPEEQGKDYMYAVDSDGNPYSPGWYTLNIKVIYQICEPLSISAGIENITDQRYRPYSSGIAAAGRNFILSIKATF